jgi:hypothetical protein
MIGTTACPCPPAETSLEGAAKSRADTAHSAPLGRQGLLYVLQQINKMNLILPDGCLAVFVDDTGHEALVKGQPVYGLGGCAVLATHLDRVVRKPWQEVRKQVTGSLDTPLHASSFGQTASQDQINAVATFFRNYPFARLGAIISVKTAFAEEMGPVRTIARVLGNRIVEIAKWTAFKEVKVIFESSNRADKMVEDAFGDFELQEDGRSIPVECYFMPKSAGEPALEVADFIIHAVGRQARQNLVQRGVFVRDFEAVFHSVEHKLVSFMEVDSVEINTP